MEIKARTADAAIRKGLAREVGTAVSDGWRWRVIERLDAQRTDHVRVERALEPGPAEVSRVMAAMGRRGGAKAGASKVRGDSAYYRAMAAKSAAKRKREE